MKTLAPATFSGLTKGFPLHADSIALAEIGAKGWNILREDVPLPAAVLRSSALGRNSLIMREFLDSSSASLCPHGKTTMSPQLFRRQMEDGAWGLTVATAQQILVARQSGHKRILLANQLIGKQAIQYVLDELRDDPEFDFYCLVDSVAGVNQLADQIRARPVNRPLQVLLEIGSPGVRCGCRTKAEAMQVAGAVRDSGSKLVLRGIEGFEGLLPVEPVRNGKNPVTSFLELVVEIAGLLDQENMFTGKEILLTAGGSSYFDLVTKAFTSAKLSKPTRILLRSGCYLIHDSGRYAQLEQERNGRIAQNPLPPAEAALEIWTYVQSVPEPTLAILTAGRRDCGHDAGLPVPLKWFRPGLHAQPALLGPAYAVSALSDQHAHMQVPANNSLRVGDLVGLGISHPCTTFDKWKILFVVDGTYQITSAVETYF